METTDTTTAGRVTLDYTALFEALWPDADAHCYLEAAGMNGREWFRRFRSGWRQLGAFKFGQEPGLERLVALAGGADLSFATILRSQPAAGAPVKPLAFLWAGIPLRLEPKRLHDPGLRLVVGETERVLTQLAAAPVPPSATLHEGHRLVGLWALATPLEVSAARLPLTRLARVFGGDHELADPDRATLGLPGSIVSSLFPQFTVRANATQPLRRVAIEDLERWLA